jgi:hypothetical protein
VGWTNFKSIAQQTYDAAGSPRTINATIPAGQVRIVQVTLTRVSWPANANIGVSINFADGTSAGFTAIGGDLLKRDSTPLTATVASFTHPSGQFPAGACSLVFSNDQPITTAVSIDWA